MNLPDFSHLKKLEVRRGSLAEYTLDDIQGQPVFEVSPAGEANSPYFETKLKQSTKTLRRARKGKISKATIVDHRDDERELYAKYVVKGWRGLVDAHGAEVPFSTSACAEYLRLLPDYIFDDLRSFCEEPRSFLDGDEMTDEEVGEIAGN